MKKLVIFDLDGTLLKRLSQFETASFLVCIVMELMIKMI